MIALIAALTLGNPILGAHWANLNLFLDGPVRQFSKPEELNLSAKLRPVEISIPKMNVSIFDASEDIEVKAAFSHTLPPLIGWNGGNLR